LKKPAGNQQYAVKRKVKATVSAKLKKAQVQKVQPAKSVPKAKQKTMVLKMPQTAEATVIEEKLPPGFKAKLTYNNGSVKVSADVRYETEKTDPLVKIVNVDKKTLEPVTKTYEGPPKREVYRLQSTGAEIPKADVGQAQVMPDGTRQLVELSKTKEIKVEPVDADVPQNFLPYSFMEVWGESESDTDGLREVGADLAKTGKVGAIKEFSHGYGKMYVGFLRPIISKDGSKFGVEIMLAENKRSRRRWMPAEPGASTQKASKPVVPTLF